MIEISNIDQEEWILGIVMSLEITLLVSSLYAKLIELII